ncbi:MAG: hypothetical protein ABIJ04_09860 [Bacteroidota bacterium]
MRLFLMTIIAIFIAGHTCGQCLSSEQAFKDYYKKDISSLDQIEGIWSCNKTTKIYDQNNQLGNSDYYPQSEQCAIIKVGDKFKVCNISGDNDYFEIIFSKTATSNVYLFP